MKDRRQFLKASLVAGAALCVGPAWATGFPEPSKPENNGWDSVPGILARIKPPVFRDRHFEITKFGAKGDNQTDCTQALQKAIAACHSAGGGRVLVPAGEFVTGAVHLKSNVNLHLAKNSILRFARDPRKYPVVMTRWEGVEVMNYSPFIYAFEQENIAISGEGTIDGNADCEHWWSWRGRTDCGSKPGDPNQINDRKTLFDMADKNVPVSDRMFGDGHYLRPQFIQPYRCKNVLVEGVTLRNSPMWNVHPVLCSNVTVRGLTIRSTGPNTDGCDPECSSDVLIKDCTFQTGDDCIAIKSGRNADGRRVGVPTKNIVIQNCRMQEGHGAVSVGSEISGGVYNLFVEDCRISGGTVDNAIRLKNNAMRGGSLQNIFVRNLEGDAVTAAGLAIDFYYEEGETGPFNPEARNVQMRNVNIRKADYALYLRGLKGAPIVGVRVADCEFKEVAKANVVENVADIVLQNVRLNNRLIDKSGA